MLRARFRNCVMSGLVLMTVHGTGKPPSLEDAARQLGVALEDVDASFGVVPVDPANGLYGVQVRADRLPPATEAAQPYRGPYSNPRIAPFGPVQSGPEPAGPAQDNDKNK
jgi:hypothetical protein